MDRQPKKTEMEGPLRINIKHPHSVFQCNKSEESWRREEKDGRHAGSLEESGRAARDGDEEIREMESQERREGKEG